MVTVTVRGNDPRFRVSRGLSLDFRVRDAGIWGTWAPKVCKIIACMAITLRLGFKYILGVWVVRRS